jgi:AcrR family transcriptional regulator
MTQPATRPGLRERKKQRTRQTIVEVALRMFADQGYSETTLAQIADASEISLSTFFNYFPSKDAIVFALTDTVVASIRERVIGRPEGESASSAVVAWICGDLGEIERPYTEVLRLIPGIIASDPELTAEDRLRRANVEDAFAEGFATDFGEPPDGMRARVMGVIALRAILDVWNVWYEHHLADPEPDFVELIARKAEYVGQALAAGLAAVEALPAPPEDL